MNKITPLIIVSANCVSIGIFVLFHGEPEYQHTRKGINLPYIVPALLMFTAIIVFIIDYFVRKYVSKLKKVWVLESMFIVFILFYLILQNL